MGVIKLAPSKIRFSQDSISNSFGDSTHHAGQYIGETLDEIVRNSDNANLIPNISVFNIDGTWITSDNKRLWVFQKAEELGIVRSIDVSVKHGNYYAKFARRSGGRNIHVRGNNPGGHLWQSLERQMIEEQDREQRKRQRRVREEEMETERQRREWEEEEETERQQREEEEETERQRREEEEEAEEAEETERQRREEEEEAQRQQREREEREETERQQREEEEAQRQQREQEEEEEELYY
jgi:hypothetical protein